MFFETSRRFGFSSRSLGHVMFSFAGTAQEAGAGGRSGAAGIPVHGSMMRRSSLCIMASFTFLLVHCGSLVSTLVLLGETKCPVALQWSPTPVGVVRLVCSKLKRFPSGRLVSPMHFLSRSREGKHHVTNNKIKKINTVYCKVTIVQWLCFVATVTPPQRVAINGARCVGGLKRCPLDQESGTLPLSHSETSWSFKKTRSKVSEQFTFQYHQYWIQLHFFQTWNT